MELGQIAAFDVDILEHKSDDSLNPLCVDGMRAIVASLGRGVSVKDGGMLVQKLRGHERLTDAFYVPMTPICCDAVFSFAFGRF